MAKTAKKPRIKKVKTIHELRILCLRRASYRWTYKYEALKLAKVVIPDGTYLNGNPKTKTLFRCAKCKELFGQRQVQADHIVEIGTFVDWNQYIPALLCETNSYQILCKPCHKAKTALYLGKKAKSRKKLDKKRKKD